MEQVGIQVHRAVRYSSYDKIWNTEIYIESRLIRKCDMDNKHSISELSYCSDVIMSAVASQLTRVSIVCSTVFRHRSKKTAKLRVTVSIWWRHHEMLQWGQHTSFSRSCIKVWCWYTNSVWYVVLNFLLIASRIMKWPHEEECPITYYKSQCYSEEAFHSSHSLNKQKHRKWLPQ